MKGLTYQAEAERIRQMVDRGEEISGYEFNFLIHTRLMRDLEDWAHENNLPFVDVIELLDKERHHMLSYVHLDAYANRKIAEALAEEILRHTCQ